MTDTGENIRAAIANAADKLAAADTVEEALQWQSIISNLTGSLSQVGETPIPPGFVPEPVAEAPDTDTESFRNLDVTENATDEINVEDEDVGN
jgi:hypothetical protein